MLKTIHFLSKDRSALPSYQLQTQYLSAIQSINESFLGNIYLLNEYWKIRLPENVPSNVVRQWFIAVYSLHLFIVGVIYNCISDCYLLQAKYLFSYSSSEMQSKLITFHLYQVFSNDWSDIGYEDFHKQRLRSIWEQPFFNGNCGLIERRCIEIRRRLALSRAILPFRSIA